MRRRSLISSSNKKKAMIGEVSLYLKWFDAVAKFDGVCAGQHPQAPLYFNPYPKGEDDRMIEWAQLYQDTLEELYVKERPLGGTIHPDHGRDLQSTIRTRQGDPGCEGSQHPPNYFLPYPQV
jgi:hypothetical protein